MLLNLTAVWRAGERCEYSAGLCTLCLLHRAARLGLWVSGRGVGKGTCSGPQSFSFTLVSEYGVMKGKKGELKGKVF